MKKHAHVNPVFYGLQSSRKESFTGTINALKKKMNLDDMDLADETICKALNIDMEQFATYWEADEAPKAIFDALKTAYPTFLKGVEVTKISFEEFQEDPLEVERKQAAQDQNE
ncbi:hypothetical protein GA0116948_11189 [Chitinophaga costaii]|uniref:Uncharacterized protein n=1 Tax=Chitinophaga costaii TaxID=1335309 RepID=A0A1C4F3A2_9BACT|nr:hypothetical protein [Chitinophaga costaii]PUZ22098.1 hypothetical protein DCM91_15335 [Chitinophaga costaii]SCC50410.1 hypothetical protein GA0116948_11189 [Chitinophaga costaii]